MTDFPRSIGKVAPRGLNLAGYATLESVADVPDEDLLAIHGVGPKAIRIIRATLDEMDIS